MAALALTAGFYLVSCLQEVDCKVMLYTGVPHNAAVPLVHTILKAMKCHICTSSKVEVGIVRAEVFVFYRVKRKGKGELRRMMLPCQAPSGLARWSGPRLMATNGGLPRYLLHWRHLNMFMIYP